jgi:hypothetical protein
MKPTPYLWLFAMSVQKTCTVFLNIERLKLSRRRSTGGWSAWLGNFRLSLGQVCSVLFDDLE